MCLRRNVKRLYGDADWSKQSDFVLLWRQPANLEVQTVNAQYFSAIALCSTSSKRKNSCNNVADCFSKINQSKTVE